MDGEHQLEIIPPGEFGDDEFLAQAEGQIRGYGKLVVSGIVEIGRKLVEVKERVGHGKYTAFVTDRLRLSERAGRNFVSVYEMFKTAKFASSEALTIDASSLYLIAAPSTTEEARQTVLEKAATPEGISRKEVEEIIKKSRASDAATHQHQLAIARQDAATELAAARQNAARLERQIADASTTLRQQIAAARAEVEQRYDGKLVLTEAELAAKLESINAAYDRRLAVAVQERDRAVKLANSLQAAVNKRPAAAATLPEFDSGLSMRAMLAAQSVAALRASVSKITPEQHIAIERELAERFHKNPRLAQEKFAGLITDIRTVMPWLQKMVSLIQGEG